MLQLVYTSAPKLLEAGKTGFGTIARCKDIPTPLVLFLERISTLDRQCGVTEYQTYCSYKLGRDTFHIFTRVADCGADYTGRTNHLAQHFIVEEGTGEFATMQMGTPAGIMLGLHGMWHRGSWTSGPTFLQPSDPPASYPIQACNAWVEHTGDSSNALWLNTHKLATGACLTGDIPDFIPLLHDAYLERADRGWGLGFCTICASNISLQRFPVLCLCAAQSHAGVTIPRGLPELRVDRTLTAPAEAEVIRPPKPETPPEPQAPVIPLQPEPEAPTPLAPAPPQEVVVSRHPAYPPHPVHTSRSQTGNCRRKGKKSAPSIGIGIFIGLAVGSVALLMMQQRDAQVAEAPAKKEATPPPAAKKEAKPEATPVKKTIATQEPEPDPATEKKRKRQQAEAAAKQAAITRSKEIDGVINEALAPYKTLEGGSFHQELERAIHDKLNHLYKDIHADVAPAKAEADAAVKALVENKFSQVSGKHQQLKGHAAELRQKAGSLMDEQKREEVQWQCQQVEQFPMPAEPAADDAGGIRALLEAEEACDKYASGLTTLEKGLQDMAPPAPTHSDQQFQSLEGKYITCCEGLEFTYENKTYVYNKRDELVKKIQTKLLREKSGKPAIEITITVNETKKYINNHGKELKKAIIDTCLGGRDVDITRGSKKEKAAAKKEYRSSFDMKGVLEMRKNLAPYYHDKNGACPNFLAFFAGFCPVRHEIGTP